MAERLSSLDWLLKIESPAFTLPKLKGLTVVEQGWIDRDGAIIVRNHTGFEAYYRFRFERDEPDGEN